MVRGDGNEAAAIEVSVGEGSIRVERTATGVLISSGSRWEQRLTREEAWRHAEAIDAMATSASDSE